MCVTHEYPQSLDSKSNVTSLDFSHDGAHLVVADENETLVPALKNWKVVLFAYEFRVCRLAVTSVASATGVHGPLHSKK